MGTPEGQIAPLFSRNRLVKLIIPLIIEQMLAMTVGMADTIMVSGVGEAAVSGVNLVDSINILLIQVFSALATGGAVLVSQYLGRQDNENACKAAKQLVYVITGVSLALMALALCLRVQILSLIFGHVEPAVMEHALIYFLLTACSFPFLAIYNSGAALFRAMGNSKVSMFTSLLMNVVNIGGNAILIFGFGWGAKGAGTATLVSRALSGIIMLVLICHKKHPVHVEKIWRPEFHPDMIGRILKIGVPTGVESGMFQCGRLLVQRLTSSFGTSAIAANAICNSLISMVNIPGVAVGLALITVVGQCVGARQPEQAVKYTRKLLLVVYATMGALSVALFFAAPQLVHLFNLTPEAMSMSVQILRLCAVFTLTLWPLSFCLPNALRAAGDAKFTMVISMCSMWAFRIGLSYFFGGFLGFQLLGIWMAMFVDWGVRSAIFLTRFLRGRWKEIRLI